MPDTVAMLAASLMSAGVGFVCGIIVGRDTRTTITYWRREESRALAVTESIREWPDFPDIEPPENGSGQIVFPQPVRRGSVRGSNPQWVSISQVRARDNGPLYAIRIQGVEGWYYCTEAVELGNGRLWQRCEFFHGKEVTEYTVDRGEWIRCR